MRRNLTVPILGVSVVFTDSSEEAHRIVVENRTKIESYLAAKFGWDMDDPEIGQGGYVQDSGGIVVMCVEDGEQITHEAVHAAWEVCHRSGIKCDWNNQEPMAYIAQWLYDQWQRKMGD